MPVAEKAARADFVIHNDGDVESLRRKTRGTWHRVVNKER
jgi:dephospho-CoA kinase